MIGNITKGRRAAGALRYDFGPGRRDEHVEPRFVAGTVVGTPQQVARLIDHHTRQRPDIKAPIWRVSLSLPDEDGVLDDRVWAAIAETYVQRMGYGDTPWVAVRHGPDHIHLTVSRLGWDGQLVDDSRDYARNRAVLDVLEQEYGLVRAADRYRERGPGVRSGAELAGARTRGVEPERLRIREHVEAARDAAAGRGRTAFEAELTRRGVDFRANVAPSTGRMNGYSFSLPTWRNGDGGQIWVTASKTGRDLAWARLRPVLDPPTGPVQPAPEPAVEQQQEAASRLDIARQALQAARDRAPVAAVRTAVEARPFGALPERQLTTMTATARDGLTAAQAVLTTETARVVRLDGIASGVTVGWARRALERQREGLETAVAAEAEAAGYATQAGQHRTQARAARTVHAEETEKAGARWRPPGRRAAHQEMAQTALQFAVQAEAEAARLERRAANAMQRARAAAPDVAAPPIGASQAYAEALARFDASRPAADSAALRADVARARQGLADVAPTVQAARVQVAQVRRRLDQLLAEQQHRAGLTPDQAGAEEAVRAELLAEASARAARSRSTTSTRAPRKRTPQTPPTQLPPTTPVHRRQDPPGRSSGRPL